MLMGRQPAGPGQEPRGVLDARRAVGELPGRAGLRLLLPPAGIPRPRYAGGSGAAGRRRVRAMAEVGSHPAHRRPGRSRADHRPRRQRPYGRQGPLVMAPRTPARSTRVRVDGTGPLHRVRVDGVRDGIEHGVCDSDRTGASPQLVKSGDLPTEGPSVLVWQDGNGHLQDRACLLRVGTALPDPAAHCWVPERVCGMADEPRPSLERIRHGLIPQPGTFKLRDCSRALVRKPGDSWDRP